MGPSGDTVAAAPGRHRSGSGRERASARSVRPRTESRLPASTATLACVAGLAIGESLAYINWTVLSALAVGSFAAVVLLRLRTDATRGFLGFTAFC